MSELNFDNEAQLDAFLGQLVEDAKVSSEGRPSSYIKLYMNRAAGTLGSMTLLPILAKNLGSFYKKIPGVKEWYGPSSLINNDEGYGFYKILPREFYGDLTPEQEKLYQDVVDKYDEAWESGEFGYDGQQVQRIKSYSIFTGIVLGQVNTDEKVIEDNLNKAVLAIYPSVAPVVALQGTISSKQAILKDKLKPWLMNFLTPSLKDRNGVITIKFNSKASGQPGYDSSVSMDLNSEYAKVVPEGFEISEDQYDAVSDPIKLFLSWMYDWDNQTYFNETAFRELLEAMTISLNELSVEAKLTEEPQGENKNGSVDPMVFSPMPGVPNDAVGGDNKTEPNKPTAGAPKNANPFDM